MGLFSGFINLFKRNIVCGDEVECHLIYKYPLRRRTVKVNSNILVRKDFVACFVLGNRISDILFSGKHRLNGTTIPTTFDRLKLGKASKHGNMKKRFKADVYFINLKQFNELHFTSNEPFITRSERFGKIKGFCEGIYSLQITEPDKIVRYFISRIAYIKNGYALKQINVIVGNVVNQILEKSKLSFSEVLLQPSKLKQYLNPYVQERLSEIGISVTNVELTSLKLTKKIQRKVNEFLSGNVSYNLEEDGLAVKVFENNEPETTFVVPEKILVDVKNEKISAETAEGVAEISAIPMEMSSQTITSENNTSLGAQPSGNINPLFQRRMGSTTTLSVDNVNTKYTNSNLNAEEVLTNSTNFKICKYCSSKIEQHYKFCPKCGVKQII